MVRVPDFKSGGSGSKFCSNCWLELFCGRTEFNSLVMLVNSQGSASQQLGFVVLNLQHFFHCP